LFQCVEESGVDVNQIQTCFTSSEGYQMMLNAEKETKAMTPGPLFVPTIVFNDVRVVYFYVYSVYTCIVDIGVTIVL
jgi:hypothetical protein